MPTATCLWALLLSQQLLSLVVSLGNCCSQSDEQATAQKVHHNPSLQALSLQNTNADGSLPDLSQIFIFYKTSTLWSQKPLRAAFQAKEQRATAADDKTGSTLRAAHY